MALAPYTRGGHRFSLGEMRAANWSEPRLFRDPWRVNMTAAKKNLDTVGETSRRAMTVKEVEAERRKA